MIFGQTFAEQISEFESDLQYHSELIIFKHWQNKCTILCLTKMYHIKFPFLFVKPSHILHTFQIDIRPKCQNWFNKMYTIVNFYSILGMQF